jgi:hypothetical protein
MAEGAHCVLSLRVEKGGVIAVPCNAGCPGGQSRKNVLARGGGYVLIHHVNANEQPHHMSAITRYLGLDVHKDSITIAIAEPGPKGKDLNSDCVENEP